MLRIPQLLDQLLTAQAEEAGAKARAAGFRAALEDEARRRYQLEGAAPRWTAPGAGVITFDPPGEWTARVADPAAYGSYVAQHFPSEATAVVELPVDRLEAALEALEFAGVPLRGSRVEVRPEFTRTYLEGLAVEVNTLVGVDDGPAFLVVDDRLGLAVDGCTGTRDAGGLDVRITPRRKREAIEEAKAKAAADVEALVVLEDGADAPVVDEAALAARIADLEERPLADLKRWASEIDVARSGTKAQLADRIARAEAVTGSLGVVHPPTPLMAGLDQVMREELARPVPGPTQEERDREHRAAQAEAAAQVPVQALPVVLDVVAWELAREASGPLEDPSDEDLAELELAEERLRADVVAELHAVDVVFAPEQPDEGPAEKVAAADVVRTVSAEPLAVETAPVAEALARQAGHVFEALAGVDLEVPPDACPTCGASDDQPCATSSGRDHPSRNARVINVIGILAATPEAEAAAVRSALPETLDGLKGEARRRRLPVAGSKAQLAERIVAHEIAQRVSA